MAIYTHEQIDLAGGIFSKINADRNMWGNNAVQSISISRNSPREAQQAIGHLGIVDYTSGIVSSDVQIDCILTEGSSKAGLNTSVYKYGRLNLTAGGESYVATSFGLGFSAGSPATFSIGLLTNGLASYMGILTEADTPDVETGEESSFAVVMGDDGTGILIAATWKGTAPDGSGSTIPVYDATGALVFRPDNAIPPGVQSLNFNSTINRDQILDVRTSAPVQYITTYPIDTSVDMEVFEPPYDGDNQPGETGYQPDRAVTNVYGSYWDKLDTLSVITNNLDKHNNSADANATLAPTSDPASPATATAYVKAIGLVKQSESESVSVGRQISYSVNFSAADLQVPMPEITPPPVI